MQLSPTLVPHTGAPPASAHLWQLHPFTSVTSIPSLCHTLNQEILLGLLPKSVQNVTTSQLYHCFYTGPSLYCFHLDHSGRLLKVLPTCTLAPMQSIPNTEPEGMVISLDRVTSLFKMLQWLFHSPQSGNQSSYEDHQVLCNWAPPTLCTFLISFLLHPLSAPLLSLSAPLLSHTAFLTPCTDFLKASVSAVPQLVFLHGFLPNLFQVFAQMFQCSSRPTITYIKINLLLKNTTN